MPRASHAVRPLALAHVSYTYPDAPEPVLEDVTLSFPPGWTGILGDNGCGKSTLARIACRQLVPGDGTVSGPSNCLLCEQDASVPPTGLEDFACDYGAEAIRLRHTLGISDDMAWRSDALSFGERKKLQVAVALWASPEVLVLDEPTNHVDAPTRRAIVDACRDFTGIGLLVSHDREMLDELCAQCACFEGEARHGRARRVVLRPGGYSDVRRQAGVERLESVRRRERVQAEARRLREEQRKREALAARTASRRSARGLDKHDNDGRERRRLAVYSGQDGRAGKLAARMGSRVESLEEAAGALRVERRYDGEIWIGAEPHPRPVLVRVPACALPLGEGRSLEVPDLYVGNRDHVGITGPNGSGKSTLVAELVRHLPDDVNALVIAQEQSAESRARFLDRIRELDAGARGELLSIVAQLNSDPKRLLATCLLGNAEPSPGELRKLMLADAVLRRCPLLVMDEPTNHLDLHSVEILEAALTDFPGSLVLVSHDAVFLERCTNRRWHVEAGCVRKM